MLPFTPRAKDNLAAWMVGAERRRALRPARRVPVPEAEDRLRSATDSGPHQSGPGDLAADHAVEPAGLAGHLGHAARHSRSRSRCIYVRPLYLRSPQSSIPELKRVIVAYQNQIVMAETLTQALAQIFGREVAKALAPDQLASTRHVGRFRRPACRSIRRQSRRPGAAADLAALAAEAQTHFDNAEKAQRAGDWALYGEEMSKVRDVLDTYAAHEMTAHRRRRQGTGQGPEERSRPSTRSSCSTTTTRRWSSSSRC